MRAIGLVAGALDHAGDLVAERERQRAILGDVEPPVAAEFEIAVLKMQVGMATPQRSMRTSTSLPRGAGQSTTVSQSGCP